VSRLAPALERLGVPTRRRLVVLRRVGLGYVFILPWLITFLAFDAVPTVAAFYFSLTDYSVLKPGAWVGLANYIQMFTGDNRYWVSVGDTLYYTVFAVPLGILVALALATLLNRPVVGTGLFRSLFYLPSVVPSVAAAIVWLWIFDPLHGILNYALVLAGIPPVHWLSSPDWAKPSLILMSLWSTGGTMVIFLAGLQGIPSELYQAAAIDGANRWRTFVHITVPLLTPTIFFSLVMGVIGSFQVFNAAFIMTAGGPLDATLFYMLDIYNYAFQFFKMGYASAMSVVLFAAVMLLTLVIFFSGRFWVHYGGGAE
jgi:multiple sugar transport system permease protein